jgi:hypothetical protein
MASIIKVDKLTGKSGTDASAPITLSGDTATLGTGVTINSTIPAAGITGTLGSGITFPAGIQKFELFKHTVEDGPSTSVGNAIASFDFTPTRNSTRQMYWYSLATRVATGSTNHLYVEIDVYDNDNSVVKIDAQQLVGSSLNLPGGGSTAYTTISTHCSYDGLGTWDASHTPVTLTAGVSYKMRLICQSHPAAVTYGYTGTNDTTGADLQMSLMCFE